MDNFSVSLASALFKFHRNIAVEFQTLMLRLQKSWFRSEVRRLAIVTEVFRSYSLEQVVR